MLGRIPIILPTFFVSSTHDCSDCGAYDDIMTVGLGQIAIVSLAVDVVISMSIVVVDVDCQMDGGGEDKMAGRQDTVGR
jgi:hypothetical protein